MIFERQPLTLGVTQHVVEGAAYKVAAHSATPGGWNWRLLYESPSGPVWAHLELSETKTGHTLS